MRGLIYILVIAVALGAAAVAYHAAHRAVVVERPTLNGPPPQRSIATELNLVGHAMPPIPNVDLHGRVAVVTVWATWCKPCQMELPRLEKEIWQAHRNDVTVIGIADRQGADVVERFRVWAALTFPLVADPTKRLTRLYGRDAPIPRTFVAGRDGIVKYQHIGYSEKSFDEMKRVVEREIAH